MSCAKSNPPSNLKLTQLQALVLRAEKCAGASVAKLRAGSDLKVVGALKCVHVTRLPDPDIHLHIFRSITSPTPSKWPPGRNQILRILSSCFERQWSEQSRSEDVLRKQSETKRKPMREQNWNDDALRMRGEIDKKPSLVPRSRERRQDPQHSKTTYVPAIPSRNHFVSRQTRASAHRAPSPAPRTSPARPY